MTITTNHNYSLIPVDYNSPHFAAVKEQFEQVIAPIYGDQTVALQKIGEGTDRECVVAELAGRVAGILVYKRNPTEEFAPLGIDRALEIKTLFVINAANNSGQGIGSKLMEQVNTFVTKENRFAHIVVTVSDTKTDSLNFFEKKGFQKISTLDKFKSPEHILFKKTAQEEAK
jgi:L-amino acid N-acyltransferase YncA